MTPKEIFSTVLPPKLQAKGDAVTKVNAIYQFDITGEGAGKWWVDCTKSGGQVGDGENAGAKCTIIMAAKDFVDMATGKLNGQMAFMTGKLKIKGDMSLAMKLGNVLGL
ncbi:MAG TPA: SCP2 sterol-binding domain-containing protein [Myxococcota bacterium]|nr:SCP2 sterol-binding domain-containing protein [Myxococcota bacterium]HRY97068.1 SCP2 sterol-binding domain-containing protein [Myxococcota bacterium]HSA21451.1 SCP2 sterol-binding domain-containing protein [Myxococcota bacterium]